MQGLAMGQQRDAQMGQLAQWMVGQQQQKDAAASALEMMLPANDPNAAAATGAGGEEPGEAPSGWEAMAAHGQKADAIRNLVKAYRPNETDMHKGLRSLSLGQLEGMMKGIGMQQGIEEQQTKQQLMGMQIAKLKQYEDETASLQRFGQHFANAPGAPGTPGGWDDTNDLPVPGTAGTAPTMEQRFMYALGKEPGAFASPQLDNIAKALQGMGRTANEIPVERFGIPQEVPGMPNVVYVPTNKGGGQLEPTGNITEVRLPNGQVAGYKMNGKYFPKEQFDAISAFLEPAREKGSGKIIPNLYVNPRTGAPVRGTVESPLQGLLDAINFGRTLQPGSTPVADQADPMGLFK
jgi:hypothetical protein